MQSKDDAYAPVLAVKPAFDPRVFGLDDGRFALYADDGQGPNWVDGFWLTMTSHANALPTAELVRGYPVNTPGASWKFSCLQSTREMVANKAIYLTVWNDLGNQNSGTGSVDTDPPLILAYEPATGMVRGVPPNATGGFLTEWKPGQ